MNTKPIAKMTELEKQCYRLRHAISWSLCDARDDRSWNGMAHGDWIVKEYERMSSLLKPISDDDLMTLLEDNDGTE